MWVCICDQWHIILSGQNTEGGQAIAEPEGGVVRGASADMERNHVRDAMKVGFVKHGTLYIVILIYIIR